MNIRLGKILAGGLAALVLSAAGAAVRADGMQQVKIMQAAGEEPAPVKIENYNVGKDRIALKGYDPVAYFAQNKAMKGDEKNAAQYRGIIYHFASPENLQLFEASPEKYLPAYGGWCSYAMASGAKVKIDPRVFKITGDQLYLFYSGTMDDTLKMWNADEKGLIEKANAAWQKIEAE